MAEPALNQPMPVAGAAPAKQAPVSAGAEAMPEGQAMPVLTPTTPTAARTRPIGTSAGVAPAADVARQRPGGRRGLPSSAYLLLAAASLGMALLLLVAPKLTARLMFNRHLADPLDAQHTILLRLLGGASFVGAGAAAAIASGSWGGDSARSADLAKLGLLGQGLANALTFAYYSATLSRLNLPVELVVNGACALLPGLDLLATGGHRGLLRELGRRLAPPAGTSLLAGAHYLLALLFPLSGVALFCFPHTALYHFFGYSYGASTFLVSKLAGVADKWFLPLVNLLLKDAAERGALRSRAPRLLNTGQLLCSLVHISNLLPFMLKEGGGWMLPVNLATWMLSFATSAAGLVLGSAPGAATSPGQREVPPLAPATKEE